METWWECDASVVEINPLCIVTAPDGKEASSPWTPNRLDDNALTVTRTSRHMRDLGEEAPLETEASKFNLNYIKLDGSIACLSMARAWPWPPWTSSSISAAARPTSWTSAAARARNRSPRRSKSSSGPDVKGILVNIFGGIMDCNVIATGIVAAVKETGLKLPLVVRLKATTSSPASRPSPLPGSRSSAAIPWPTPRRRW